MQQGVRLTRGWARIAAAAALAQLRWPGCLDQCRVDVHVVLCHGLRGEAAHEPGSNFRAGEGIEPGHGADCPPDIVDDIARHAADDPLRYRAAIERDDR